jgi:glycerol-1-phosphate dehydrogenase [NAD(P)+]
MRSVEFGTKAELHGLQCAAGTMIAAKLYEKLKQITPDKQKALAHAEAFDYDVWSETLRAFLGKGAESMIALETKEKKYDPALHAVRLDKLIANWDAIMEIVSQEIPAVENLKTLYGKIGLPGTLTDIGEVESLLPTVLRCTKDIRDKYVLSRMAWDLGIEEELFG